jgi:hypothetical protein
MFSIFYAIFWLHWLHISDASPVNYGHRAEDFVKIFMNCVRNETCVFYSWKVQQTEASIVNIHFRHVFPKTALMGNCCMEQAVKKFKANVEKYCLSKFSAHEVTEGQMRWIVETCSKLRPRSNAILLFTYEDPYSYYISRINKLCNRYLKLRPAEVQRVCHVCEYANNTMAFFDNVVNKTNSFYLSMAKITDMNFSNVQVLLIDNVDLEKFFLNPSLRPDFDVFQLKKRKPKTDFCNFGLKTEVMKKLSVSTDLYRQLTHGRRVLYQ